jgi:GNAT superfamily N-acetyltransferase
MSSPRIELRTMTKADIPAGMRLKEIAGWNQTEADWQRFLDASKDGCFVAETDGAVRGTAATISFEGRFAWVGMVLVDPGYRGRGIGTALLEKSIAYLDSMGIPSIKLDATPAGKPIYEKLGFVTEYEIERWTLQRPARSGRPGQPAEELDPMPAPVVQQILRADREEFGADRSALLRSVHNSHPQFTAGLWNAGGLEGYAFGRQGSFADHLGPWIARNELAAQQMLKGFLSRSAREVVVTDCALTGAFAKSLLQAAGFTYSRSLTRMYRGSNRHPGRPEFLCAILGPEFG